MIGKLKNLLGGLLPDGGQDGGAEQPLELTVTVLLMEMARADHRIDAAEEQEIGRQIRAGFGLSESDVGKLLPQARDIAENSVSLQAFTRRLHTRLDYPEKLRVIEMLWQVALADRSLDKYEDYLLARLGELMYVSRGDVLRIRNRVMESLTPPQSP
ncbi:MAG TPA: TerB family tellurite resistance protein [Chromatiales bacterium]|nr:TerB family tellurite resistance protein [Chromatiales bacterium]